MWDIINAFFAEQGLTGHHLRSFNRFVEHGLQRVACETAIGDYADPGTIKTDIEGLEVHFGTVRLGSPVVKEADGSVHRMLPMEARIRKLTYTAPLYLELILVKDGIEEEKVEVDIGSLPIMVRSMVCNLDKANMEKDLGHELNDQEYEAKLKEAGEDPSDPGGYFIINGSERVLVTVEDLAPNGILVGHEGAYGASMEAAKVFSQKAGRRALVIVEKKSDGTLMASIPAISGQISLTALMRGLGMETDEGIARAIGEERAILKFVLANLEVDREGLEVQTVDDAWNLLGRRVAPGQAREYRLKRVESLLDRTLLPHLGNSPEDRTKKAIYLGRMGRLTIQLALGKTRENDKDHYANKRLKRSGDLMGDLFRVAFVTLARDLKYQLERTYARSNLAALKTAIRSNVLTERMLQALATGNWIDGRTGVSQLLDRTCRLATLSHLRRVISPLSRSQAHFEARDLHATQWGRLCPCETPEGPNCGLVKNLALLAEISTGCDEEGVKETLLQMGVSPIKSVTLDGTGVYVNGDLVGVYDAPQELVGKVREIRRQGLLSHELNISYDEDNDNMVVDCDAGRLRRPLIVVQGAQPLLTAKHHDLLSQGSLTWHELIAEGIVEYIDAGEEEDLLIATDEEELTEEYTHMEVDPAAIFGICAAIVPYPEHNSSPRDTMGAGMMKQSLGLGEANYRIRPDTRSHLLHYPQTPMVRTKVMDIVHTDQRPAGQNWVVGVLPYEGYNMQDAIIINRASLDRALGRSTFFRTYDAEERRYPGGQEDHCEVPGPEVGGARPQEVYRYLDADGLIHPETKVRGNDVLIGKTSPPRFLEEPTELLTPQKRKETSIKTRPGDRGVVDSVMITESENGSLLVTCKVRDERVPEVGDKFASRHGQKGVIGAIVPPEDMPFNEDGVVPDMLINPHAIPSRMTVGHVLEMIGGKVGCAEGRFVDGTPFSGEPESELRDALVRNGFRDSCSEVLYDGRTGDPIGVQVFVGVIYYMKLHHMVADKFHARARGPMQVLTRQPTEGRIREGGLRFGEMERDCLIAHGSSMVTVDRLLEESDVCRVLVCQRCGHIAMEDRRGVLRCPLCKDEGEIYPVRMSYAFKLLLDELQSMMIAPRLRLGDVA